MVRPLGIIEQIGLRSGGHSSVLALLVGAVREGWLSSANQTNKVRGLVANAPRSFTYCPSCLLSDAGAVLTNGTIDALGEVS